MSIKKALYFALAIFFGGKVLTYSPQELHEWVLKMHRAQIELLKIDWGGR